MTNDLAIRILNGEVLGTTEQTHEAVAMAVKALSALPSAQTDLITKMQNGIKATDADDPYSCGMRNGIRWCMSLIDDKEPLYENCPHCGARMDGE